MHLFLIHASWSFISISFCNAAIGLDLSESWNLMDRIYRENIIREALEMLDLHAIKERNQDPIDELIDSPDSPSEIELRKIRKKEMDPFELHEQSAKTFEFIKKFSESHDSRADIFAAASYEDLTSPIPMGLSIDQEDIEGNLIEINDLEYRFASLSYSSNNPNIEKIVGIICDYDRQPLSNLLFSKLFLQILLDFVTSKGGSTKYLEYVYDSTRDRIRDFSFVIKYISEHPRNTILFSWVISRLMRFTNEKLEDYQGLSSITEQFLKYFAPRFLPFQPSSKGFNIYKRFIKKIQKELIDHNMTNQIGLESFFVILIKSQDGRSELDYLMSNNFDQGEIFPEELDQFLLSVFSNAFHWSRMEKSDDYLLKVLGNENRFNVWFWGKYLHSIITDSNKIEKLFCRLGKALSRIDQIWNAGNVLKLLAKASWYLANAFDNRIKKLASGLEYEIRHEKAQIKYGSTYPGQNHKEIPNRFLIIDSITSDYHPIEHYDWKWNPKIFLSPSRTYASGWGDYWSIELLENDSALLCVTDQYVKSVFAVHVKGNVFRLIDQDTQEMIQKAGRYFGRCTLENHWNLPENTDPPGSIKKYLLTGVSSGSFIVLSNVKKFKIPAFLTTTKNFSYQKYSEFIKYSRSSDIIFIGLIEKK